ncbi:glycine cleavage system aminomethyltransferase GcvT [Parafrigoribacterium soli]|uniref:glycine cleavage system aminomethyltransferase GcvT n=1 Tax=Parafrigoribacterium soli TaxID=3144663 RepID=UPI0032EF06C6
MPDPQRPESSDPGSDGQRLSPLHQIHVDAGASFTDFAGWQMPVRYSSDLAEHHAVRNSVALFDLSHMAEILVTGPDAGRALDYALASKISDIAVGQVKYSLLLTRDGGIVDDVVIYRTHKNRYGVVANASNRFAVAGALAARAADFDVTVFDESDGLALVAVQGPNALAVLERLDGLETVKPVGEVGYYWSTMGTYHGNEIMVGRTGYTGEDGFELYVRVENVEQLWRELMTAGAEYGIVPAGLASRDTLRLEAGMPLYGHELSTDIMPAQAGLSRVVNLTKPDDFVGREASEVALPEGARVLVGLVSEGKRAGRAGYAVYSADDREIGVVTSGALSPTLGYPIAMAYLDPVALAEPGGIFIDVRGTRVAASVVALPFYKRPTAHRESTEKRTEE